MWRSEVLVDLISGTGNSCQWFDQLTFLVSTIPQKEALSIPPNQPYKPKPTMKTQIKSNLYNIWTPPPSSHTTPYWSVMPVTATTRSMPLFYAHDPFRYDTATWYLSQYILLCATLWYMSLLCATMYTFYSVIPITDPCHPWCFAPTRVTPSRSGLCAAPRHQHMPR